jgi:hypothetical protein
MRRRVIQKVETDGRTAKKQNLIWSFASRLNSLKNQHAIKFTDRANKDFKSRMN